MVYYFQILSLFAGWNSTARIIGVNEYTWKLIDNTGNRRHYPYIQLGARQPIAKQGAG